MDDLGAQEEAVLSLIRKTLLRVSRRLPTSWVSPIDCCAHIVRLMEKGYILGRGYVLPQASRAVCIGGAVFDRKYRARQQVVLETSNPVGRHAQLRRRGAQCGGKPVAARRIRQLYLHGG